MCIAIWSSTNQLGYKLILASNRDEFLSRPSLPAHWHSFEPIQHHLQTLQANPTTNLNTTHGIQDNHQEHPILSGRDSIAGGTWLGINKKTGKYGFLTNVTPQLDHIVHNKEEEMGNPAQDRPTPASRGLIIQEFLRSKEGVESYIANLKSSRTSQDMNGYNLVIGQVGKNGGDGKDRIGFFCNRDPQGMDTLSGTISNLHPGPSESTLVHGVSNGIACQAPIWPKVTRGIDSMQDCLSKIGEATNSRQTGSNNLEMELFNLLSQTDDSTDEIPCNILIRPHHRVASPDTPHSLKTWYGTRTQTILLISQTTPAQITLVERDAFQIQLLTADSSEPNLGIPIWMGDDPSRWRRFDFQSPS